MRSPTNWGTVSSVSDKPIKIRYTDIGAIKNHAQLDSEIKDRDVMQEKVSSRDANSSGFKDGVILSEMGIIILIVKNSEVLKYPSAILNSFLRDVKDAMNGTHVERRSVLGDMKNIPLYVWFGHNFGLEQKSEEKGRNGYVGYAHMSYVRWKLEILLELEREIDGK